jgi:hypothetical protein
MADITFNPVAGVPFSGPIIMKDCTGTGGPYAPVSLGMAGFLPVQSLAAVSAIQNGTALDNQGVRNNHSIVVTTSAGVSAGVVALQGSQDGVNWITTALTSVTTAAATTTYLGTVVSLTPLRYLRAAITTTITGGTITAYVASAG